MNPDFFKFIEQAQKIKKEFEEKKSNMEKEEFTGSSGGDLVTATINGKGQMVKLVIDDSLKKPGNHTIEDLVIAAINNAHKKFSDASSAITPSLDNMPNISEMFK